MALARTLSVALVGVDAHVVEVEAHVGSQLPEARLQPLHIAHLHLELLDGDSVLDTLITRLNLKAASLHT